MSTIPPVDVGAPGSIIGLISVFILFLLTLASIEPLDFFCFLLSGLWLSSVFTPMLVRFLGGACDGRWSLSLPLEYSSANDTLLSDFTLFSVSFGFPLLALLPWLPCSLGGHPTNVPSFHTRCNCCSFFFSGSFPLFLLGFHFFCPLL